MTDYNHIVRLVLKLSGVGLVVYGGVTLFSNLPGLLQAQNWSEWPASIMTANVIALTMPLLFGAFLWFFPAVVANTIVRVDSETKGSTDFGFELERIGVALLGLYFLYQAVSDIIYQTMVHRAKVALLGSVRAPDDFSAFITAIAVEIVLALLLLFQSKGVVNLMRKARGH